MTCNYLPGNFFNIFLAWTIFLYSVDVEFCLFIYFTGVQLRMKFDVMHRISRPLIGRVSYIRIYLCYLCFR